MRIELLMVAGKDMGYTLVPEDENDKAMLKRVQSMNFLASNKQEKMQYDGVMLDLDAHILRMMFMQRKYAVLPEDNTTKKEIYKAIMQKGETV